MIMNKITPDNLTTLEPNEIFVFGSNLQGSPEEGAAPVAYQQFGAKCGQGVGLQGQSYAIPTMHGGIDSIAPYVNDVISFALSHPELQFNVTRIGCNFAGFRDKDITPLFRQALNVNNIALPQSFVNVLFSERLSFKEEFEFCKEHLSEYYRTYSDRIRSVLGPVIENHCFPIQYRK